MASERRTQDIRTRLVHSSSLDKSGHYDYVEYTDCGINTSAGLRSYDWKSVPFTEPVTCLRCLGTP